MANIAETTIQHKVVTIVISVLLVVGGIYSFNKLGRLEDPEFTIKNALIYTRYPGATAMEVSEEVTDKIETAVQKLGQIDKVTSLSTPGFSNINVEIKDRYNKKTLPQVWDELRRKVSDVQVQLPPGTSSSIVYDDYGDVYGVFLAVYGDGFSYAELKEHAKLLRRELLLVQDVGDISIYGAQEEVIYVEISHARLSLLAVSINAIYNTLQGQNLVAPAGDIEVGSKYIRIQPSGELESFEQIGELLILQENGEPTKLRIRDVAEVKRGYIDPPTPIMRFNGRKAIGLGISTVEGGNVVTMGHALDKRIQELKAETPIGIEIGEVAHQSHTVDASVKGFAISLVEAVLIVIGVLMIAMGLRSGLIIGAILFMTVLASFIIMDMQGIMLQRISLGALIIALGMLVDNAIVVIEGILVNIQKGMGRIAAAASIVSQTMWPLFGATIVAILAFSAIGLSQDSTGEYCGSLFWVIMISLFISWILAITVTPFLGVEFLKMPKKQVDDPYAGKFFVMYRSFLEFCLRRRFMTVIVLIVLLVLAVVGFTRIENSFFPPSTRPQFMVHCWLPQGSHITDTEKKLAHLEEFVLSLDEVESVSSYIGKGSLRFILTYSPEDENNSYGMLLVSLKDYKKMDQAIAKVNQHVQQRIHNAQVFCRKFVLGPGEAFKIQVRLRGPDPMVLRNLKEQVKDVLRSNPDTVDVMDDWREKVSLVRPIVAETHARNAGITRKQIAATLQMTFGGITLSQYREKDELLPIKLRSTELEKKDAASLNYIQIWSPVAQKYIPLSQVVLGFETLSEDSIVRRRNRLPCITVQCDPGRGQASELFANLMPQLQKIELPVGYQMQWGGEYEDTADAQGALFSKLPPTIIMMVLIVICLFNSLKQPLIIFLNIPLAIIGVTFGLLITRQPFGFMALLGFLSLMGMLIKNAIVLIDEINTQLSSGRDSYEAIVISGVSRLRPVSMAALTTVLGMVPLLTDAFFVAMAVTIMFGLAFATVLTLIVVPVLYAIFYKIKPAVVSTESHEETATNIDQ